MKKITKLLALALALALVLSLGVGFALAADEATGSITIKDPGTYVYANDTLIGYDFYRLLDLTGQDSDPTDTDDSYDIVSYTIAPKWAGFFTSGEGADYLIPAASATAAQKESLNQIVYNGATYYLNLTESNVADFANAATRYATDNHSTVRDDAYVPLSNSNAGQDIVLSDLPLGYYLMIPVGVGEFAPMETEFSEGSIASLTSTIPDVDIQVKAVGLPIAKTDDTISADLGQKVSYTITSVVPNTVGYENYVYQILDTMTSGLTFNNDVKITVTHDGSEIDITSACTVETFDYGDYYAESGSAAHDAWQYGDGGAGFRATIPVANYQGVDSQPDYVGDTITLTYSAKVNDQAVANQSYPNTQWPGVLLHEQNSVLLLYSHNPGEYRQRTPKIREEVYTASIYVHKYTANAASDDIPLEGAKFVLMNSEGQFLKYDRLPDFSDPQNPVFPTETQWVTVSGAPTDGTAGVTNAQLKALSDAAKAGTITAVTSDDTGSLAFVGIKDDTYYLVEIEAPAGYNAMEKPQQVVVQGVDRDTASGKVENVADGGWSMDSSSDSYASVLNQTGSVLPTTGGMGTQLFYILGGVLVLAAGVVLVSRRRMKAE